MLDDNEQDFRRIRDALAEGCGPGEDSFSVAHAPDVATALGMLSRDRFDLVMVDYVQGGADGAPSGTNRFLVDLLRSGRNLMLVLLTGRSAINLPVHLMDSVTQEEGLQFLPRAEVRGDRLRAMLCAYRQNHKRVLVVEDDDDDYDILVGNLGESLIYRFSFQRETDVGHAIERLDAEPFDAVLIDYHLGATTGKELIEYMVRHRPDVPKVLVTGIESATATEPMASLISSGRLGYVSKHYLDTRKMIATLVGAMVYQG